MIASLSQIPLAESIAFFLLVGSFTTMIWGLFQFINANKLSIEKTNGRIERLAIAASFTQRMNDSRLKGIETFLTAKHGYHQRDDDRNSGADFLDIE